MGLWDGIKNWLTRKKDVKLLSPWNNDIASVGSKPLDSFSARLHEQAQQNLTLEQLCNKFAMQIGIPPEILNLPGAINLIVDNVLRNGKDVLKTDFDEAIKRFQEEFQVKIGMSGEVLITNQRNNTIEISEDESNNISIITKDFADVNQRKYDKNTKIEIFRGRNQAGVIEIYERDSLNMGEIQYYLGNSSDSMTKMRPRDITMLGDDRDIATLDGVEDAPMYMLEESYLSEYNKRLQQKIEASANRSGCCKFAGIEETAFQK